MDRLKGEESEESESIPSSEKFHENKLLLQLARDIERNKLQHQRDTRELQVSGYFNSLSEDLVDLALQDYEETKMVLQLELSELKEKLQAETKAKQVLETIKMYFQQGKITHPHLMAHQVWNLFLLFLDFFPEWYFRRYKN